MNRESKEWRSASAYNRGNSNPTAEAMLLSMYPATPGTARDDQVVEATLMFQNDNGLVPDGKLGPLTARRVSTEYRFLDEVGSIVVGGKHITVPFKAVPMVGRDGKSSDYNLEPKHLHRTRAKKPTQVVWHWDACLNAKNCYRVLAQAGVSSHGCIDNDGTFYQFLDFETRTAWHAGHSAVNKASIGIDISNAVYTKYQSWYAPRFGPRDIIEATVHGKKHELLGYYPAQVEAATALALFVNKTFGIPLESPAETTTIDSPEKFSGHLGHYHVKTSKWDPAGFPFNKICGGV